MVDLDGCEFDHGFVQRHLLSFGASSSGGEATRSVVLVAIASVAMIDRTRHFQRGPKARKFDNFVRQDVQVECL
jgi:hypothetical protein